MMESCQMRLGLVSLLLSATTVWANPTITACNW